MFATNNILLCCMYKPPKANCEYFNEILNKLDNASMEGLYIVLLGDLNINYIIDESLNNNPIHLIESLCSSTTGYETYSGNL